MANDPDSALASRAQAADALAATATADAENRVAHTPAINALAATESARGLADATQTDAGSPRRRQASSEQAMAGERLAHFQIERLLGKGAMGEVYLATDTALERPVALKILPREVARNQRLRERFYREARSQARLGHANVCHIYFVGEKDGLLFFAMEYIEGESLQERLDRGGAIPYEEAIELCRMAALGLREAHANGFTHRDIKPSNLMIDRNGVVKVVDFGLVKQAGDLAAGGAPVGGDAALTGVVGTPLYMAPEQADGGAIDLRSDIYALGATLHQLVSGKPPFAGSSAMDLFTQHAAEPRPRLVSGRGRAPIDALCDRMMAKDPADRFGSYDELIAALDRVSPARSRPAGSWVRAVALLVDLLIISILCLPLELLWSWLGLLQGTDALWVFLVGLAYSATANGRTGRTLGKAMFEIEVVSSVSAGRPTYAQAAIRFTAQWAPFLLAGALSHGLAVLGVGERVQDIAKDAGIGVAFVLLLVHVMVTVRRSPNKLAFWDRVARTQVCYAPAGRPTGKGAGKGAAARAPAGAAPPI